MYSEPCARSRAPTGKPKKTATAEEKTAAAPTVFLGSNHSSIFNHLMFPAVKGDLIFRTTAHSFQRNPNTRAGCSSSKRASVVPVVLLITSRAKLQFFLSHGLLPGFFADRKVASHL